MHIRLNGKEIELDTHIKTMSELLTHLGYEGKTVAVAVDQHFLPRSQYTSHALAESMDIEIVAPMSGG